MALRFLLSLREPFFSAVFLAIALVERGGANDASVAGGHARQSKITRPSLH
jgi:hypothetical protein